MKLQPRDRKILGLIYDHGFVLQRHVLRLFPNYTETRRRINELKRAGWLSEELSHVTYGKELRLTKKGRLVAEADSPYRFPQIKFLNPHYYFHDSFVISTRMRLEELWNGTWIPEKSYRGHQKEVPDGIFLFPSGKKIYVEVENSMKSRARFLAKHSRYNDHAALLILYVTTQKIVLNGIKSFIKRNNNPMAPYAVISLEELMNEAPVGWCKERELLKLFAKREF